MGKCESSVDGTEHHVHFHGVIGVCCRCGKSWIVEAAAEADCGPYASAENRWAGTKGHESAKGEA